MTDWLGGDAGEAEEAESGSDTEAMSWARRPAAGGRSSTRRRRRVRTITTDAACSSQFRGVSKHRSTPTPDSDYTAQENPSACALCLLLTNTVL